MKRQKRYTRRIDIVAAIDKTKATAQAECEEAERLDRDADALYAWLNGRGDTIEDEEDRAEYHLNLEKAKCFREEASRLRRYQAVRANKLARLKATLQAFDTTPMVFLGSGSVVEQKAP